MDTPLTLTEVIIFLRDNGYTTTKAGKLAFTKKFHEDHTAQKGAQDGELGLVVFTGPSEISNQFIKFIVDAKVPTRLEDNRGNPYYANKYSEDAAKEFHRIMTKEGVAYDLIMKSTMLYYKSGVRFKKAIGNYIIQGDWRTDYEDLKNSAGAGEQELKDHIKNTIDGGGYSPFKLG